MPVPRIILKTKRAQPFYARHPWVFAGLIDRVEGTPADGDEVDVFSSAENFIARGLFNSKSKIRVRLYCWEPNRELDRAFFHERLSSAIRFRDALGMRGPERGTRLVYSEADGLSGCVIDEYDRYLVMQVTALGIASRREMLADVLEELVAPAGICIRTEKGVSKLEGLDLRDGLLRGSEPPADLSIVDNGLRFAVPLTVGQKTGYFLDQRDNRRIVAGYAKGRAVLDAFSYTGGFGLQCAAAGAMWVECVDSSAPALELARHNARINNLDNVALVKADVVKHLERCVAEGRTFGMVILDPPKFARSRSLIPDALKGYRRLLTLGVKLLQPDGILVMCCCSGLITFDMLEELHALVAVQERRAVQLLGRSGQPADHPVATACMETAYLKCLISRVP